MRYLRCLILSLMSAGLSARAATSPPVLLDTAATVATDRPSRLIVSDFNWPFHRFEVTQTTTLSRVGGTFYSTQSFDIFAGIVALSGPNDNPDSIDLTTPDLIATTLLPLTPGTSLQTTPLNLTLEPGWYALQFGCNAFGADTQPSLFALGLSRHDIDLAPSQKSVVAFQVGHPSRPPSFLATEGPERFYIEAVPEPASLVAILLMSAVLPHRRRTNRSSAGTRDMTED